MNDFIIEKPKRGRISKHRKDYINQIANQLNIGNCIMFDLIKKVNITDYNNNTHTLNQRMRIQDVITKYDNLYFYTDNNYKVRKDFAIPYN